MPGFEPDIARSQNREVRMNLSISQKLASFHKLISFACAVAMSGIFNPNPASCEPMKVIVGYGYAADFLPAFVAQDEGFFAKNQLDVTLKPFPNTSVVIPALVSGGLQMGMSTLPNLLLASQAGLDLVAFAGAARLQKTNPRISLVTRNDFIVTKPEDLIGKKVGILGINSVIDMFFRQWLLSHGVSPAKVAIVETQAVRMGDLLKSGQLDAVTAIEPILSRIVESGQGVRSIDFFSEVHPDVFGSVWAATSEWAKANPAAIAAFRRSLEDGLRFVRDNPERARAIEEKYLHVVGKTEPSFSSVVRPDDFEVVDKIGRELGLITAPIDVKSLVFSGS